MSIYLRAKEYRNSKGMRCRAMSNEVLIPLGYMRIYSKDTSAGIYRKITNLPYNKGGIHVYNFPNGVNASARGMVYMDNWEKYNPVPYNREAIKEDWRRNIGISWNNKTVKFPYNEKIYLTAGNKNISSVSRINGNRVFGSIMKEFLIDLLLHIRSLRGLDSVVLIMGSTKLDLSLSYIAHKLGVSSVYIPVKKNIEFHEYADRKGTKLLKRISGEKLENMMKKHYITFIPKWEMRVMSNAMYAVLNRGWRDREEYNRLFPNKSLEWGKE